MSTDLVRLDQRLEQLSTIDTNVLLGALAALVDEDTWTTALTRTEDAK